MLLYKYRGNIGLDNKKFIESIDMICDNEIWCSRIRDLNDPTEASFSLVEFERNLISTLKIFSFLKIKKYKQENIDNYKEALKNQMKLYSNNIGVYSLSTVYDNELMWAHYGNSHRGFCIEYEFLDFKDFGIEHPDKYPKLNHMYKYSKVYYSDRIFYLSKINPDYDDIIKFLFYKSKAWSYEKEYRILTYPYGKFNYNEKCLKSITFGLNMIKEEKDFIFNKLRNKGIQFYQMKRRKNEFNFYREEVILD